MYIPVFLIVFVSFVIWFQFKLRKANKLNTVTTKLDILLNEEQKANLARRKDIPSEFFLTTEPSEFPFRMYARSDGRPKRLNACQNTVKKCMSRKMLRFETHRSNVELKKEFGVANLEIIIEYEGNYEAFLASLTNWADTLLADEPTADDVSDATRILETGLRLGADSSKHYSMLADIYFLNKDEERLEWLRGELRANDRLLFNTAALADKISDSLSQLTAGRAGESPALLAHATRAGRAGESPALLAHATREDTQ